MAKGGKKGSQYKSKQEGPTKKEIQGKADQFDALTRKFMFTITKLTKKLPDSDRMILKNINLCFYPGAKIGCRHANYSYDLPYITSFLSSLLI